MTTVLVTGATGNVGSGVVRELSGSDLLVRAFVRDAAKARRMLGDDVELAPGDLGDPDSVREAMKGADLVFLSSGDSPEKVAEETAVIDRAAAEGVRLLVKASTVRATPDSALPPLRWHGLIERHLLESGVPSVVLHSNFYMTNLLMGAEQIREQGVLAAPAGHGHVGMVDPRDVAAAAARVLADEGGVGRTYVLTGPEAISYERAAMEFSRALGREVRYVELPDEALREGLEAQGMPEWLVDHLGKLFPLVREDAFAETTDTFRTLTGRRPRTFADFARDHAGLLRAAA